MMETLLLELEEELRAAAQAAVQAVLARARQEVEQVLEAARREREAGLREVARLRWNWRLKRQPWNSFRLPSAAELSLRWAAPGS